MPGITKYSFQLPVVRAFMDLIQYINEDKMGIKLAETALFDNLAVSFSTLMENRDISLHNKIIHLMSK
jgi:hypothetical protein